MRMYRVCSHALQGVEVEQACPALDRSTVLRLRERVLVARVDLLYVKNNDR